MTHSHLDFDPACCSAATEEAVNGYVDGELPFDQHAVLFAHLAVCEGCRRSLDAAMRFRRLLREENLTVPPAVDRAFFERLAAHKRATTAPGAASDRPAHWHAFAPISLRTAVVAAALVFFVGLLVPLQSQRQDEVVLPWVEGVEERVTFREADRLFREPDAVYVIYPGLTVVGTRVAETPPQEAL